MAKISEIDLLATKHLTIFLAKYCDQELDLFFANCLHKTLFQRDVVVYLLCTNAVSVENWNRIIQTILHRLILSIMPVVTKMTRNEICFDNGSKFIITNSAIGVKGRTINHCLIDADIKDEIFDIFMDYAYPSLVGSGAKLKFVEL